MTEILRYLILLEAIGLAGVPLAARALGRLPGAGWGLARVLAWLLLAWLVWIAGSIGIPNGWGLANAPEIARYWLLASRRSSWA